MFGRAAIRLGIGPHSSFLTFSFIFGQLFVKWLAMLSDHCLSGMSVTFMYCGQTVGRMKMKLGTEVGLSPGHTVLDGDPAPPEGHSTPLFSAHVYCGHGRPYQLLLSSCNDFPGNQLPKRYPI